MKRMVHGSGTGERSDNEGVQLMLRTEYIYA